MRIKNMNNEKPFSSPYFPYSREPYYEAFRYEDAYSSHAFVDQNQTTEVINAINPYSLTEQDKALVAQLQEESKQHYIPWIQPNLYQGYTPFEAGPSATPQEVKEKYDAFQAKRSEIQYSTGIIKSAEDAYLEYKVFMANLMNNLTPELRQNPQEMLKLAKDFPEALLEIDPKILTPEFARDAIRMNPDFYPTLMENPKDWENASAITQNPNVVTTYVASVVKTCDILNSENLDLRDDLQCETNIDAVSVLPLHPNTPLHQLQALDLYKELTHKALSGQGVYSHSLEDLDDIEVGSKAVIGPVTAAQLLVRDTFPDLQPQFDELEKEVYLKVHENITPVSQAHEEHLQDFAEARNLPIIQSQQKGQTFDDGPTGPGDNR